MLSRSAWRVCATPLHLNPLGLIGELNRERSQRDAGAARGNGMAAAASSDEAKPAAALLFRVKGCRCGASRKFENNWGMKQLPELGLR